MKSRFTFLTIKLKPGKQAKLLYSSNQALTESNKIIIICKNQHRLKTHILNYNEMSTMNVIRCKRHMITHI